MMTFILYDTLKKLGIDDDNFFDFIQDKVKVYDNDFLWGCFPFYDDENYLIDIALIVPKIIDEKTLLINIHEYTHAYKLFGNLNTKYIIDIEKEEHDAKYNEYKYIFELDKCQYLK